jgi:hypothetical protein
LLNCYHAA